MEDYISSLIQDLHKVRDTRQSLKQYPNPCTPPVSTPIPDKFCVPTTPISKLPQSTKTKAVTISKLEDTLSTLTPSSPSIPTDSPIPDSYLSTIASPTNSCTLSYGDDIMTALTPITTDIRTTTNFLSSIESEYNKFINTWYSLLLYYLYTPTEDFNFDVARTSIPTGVGVVGKTVFSTITSILQLKEDGKIKITPKSNAINYFYSEDRMVREVKIRIGLASHTLKHLIATTDSITGLQDNLSNIMVTEITKLTTDLESYTYYSTYTPATVFIPNNYATIQDFLSKLDVMARVLDTESLQHSIQSIVSTVPMCGVTPTIPDTPTPPTITPRYSHTGLSRYSSSDISGLPYWVQFAIGLNSISASPQYWTVGLIVGKKKIKLPIIWIPLICIPTPVSVMVLWLTINGIVIYPVLYTLKFHPLGDSDSELTTLFRGSKKLIKSKTTSKSFGLPILGGIDISPDTSATIPYSIDDLPIQERLGLSNAPHVEFLHKWMSTAKPYMGL